MTGLFGQLQERPIPVTSVRAVIDHYLRRYPKRGISAGQQVDAIRARLREGYTVADLKAAIDGNAASAWHQDKKLDALELVVRDATHVDQFIGKAPAARITVSLNPASPNDAAKAAFFARMRLSDTPFWRHYARRPARREQA